MRGTKILIIYCKLKNVECSSPWPNCVCLCLKYRCLLRFLLTFCVNVFMVLQFVFTVIKFNLRKSALHSNRTLVTWPITICLSIGELQSPFTLNRPTSEWCFFAYLRVHVQLILYYDFSPRCTQLRKISKIIFHKAALNKWQRRTIPDFKILRTSIDWTSPSFKTQDCVLFLSWNFNQFPNSFVLYNEFTSKQSLSDEDCKSEDSIETISQNGI